MDFLIDTNILLIYLRASHLKEQLDKELNLFQTGNNQIISVVSLGEVKSLALQRKWGYRKLQQLEQLSDKFLVADLHSKPIIDRYAEIDAFSQGKLSSPSLSVSSRNMGKNDLWIAATASVLDVKLVTTDKDFNHLKDVYLNLQTIDIQKWSLR